MGECRLSGGEKVIEQWGQKQKKVRQQATCLSPPPYPVAVKVEPFINTLKPEISDKSF
jgi:hypothetical protein